MRLRYGGLRSTLVITLATIMALAVVLFSVVVLRITGRLLVREKSRGARALVATTLAELSHHYDSGRSLTNPANLQRVQQSLDRLLATSDVSSAELVDTSLVVRAAGDRSQIGQRRDDTFLAAAIASGQREEQIFHTGTEQMLYVYAPFQRDGRRLGAVRAVLRMDSTQALLEQGRELIFFYLLVDLLLLLVVASYLLDRWIIRPLRQVTKATDRVTSGQLTHYVDVMSENEIGRLARSFNQMVDTLKLSRREVDARITELEAVNRELATARGTMIRAERLASVGTLAAGIAHEVGNPLAAILGYVEILLQSTEDPEQLDVLQRVHTQVLRIHQTIGDLLDYSRANPEAERIGSVRSAVDATKTLLEPQPRMREVRINTDLPGSLPAVAISDGRLQQVLLNLGLNAADAMERAGGNLYLEASEDADCVKLRIQDEGHGIEGKDLRRVFDPFFTTKDPGKGTGLGLAIVDRILQDHGGSIEVESTPGEGTTFTISLPRAVLEEDHDEQ